MQRLRFFFLLAGITIGFIANAQFTVTGVILDSASREPLSAASVFAQNTTQGTTTNKQGEFSLTLKSGGYDLIVSYTGYKSFTLRVTGEVGRQEILMTKEDKSLGEVMIRSSNEVKDGWEKYGTFFIENFIGTTPFAAQTKIENPDVVKFYFLKKSNKLRVVSTEPMKITNSALGYTLTYQLDSFVFFYNTNISSYRGNCFYTELEGNDSLQRIWKYNREKAYYGSKLQFMRSYYDSTLVKDGWVIDMLDENDNMKFNKVADLYDTTYYGGLTDSLTEIEIWYPRKLSITYSKRKPEAEYLRKYKMPKNVATQISYVDMTDAIAIKQNGYYYDQRHWVTQGYWSWKNVADQLPYDYLP
jgi:hypothetical protein